MAPGIYPNTNQSTPGSYEVDRRSVLLRPYNTSPAAVNGEEISCERTLREKDCTFSEVGEKWNHIPCWMARSRTGNLPDSRSCTIWVFASSVHEKVTLA